MDGINVQTVCREEADSVNQYNWFNGWGNG